MRNDIKNAFDKISPVRSDDEIFVNVMRRSNMSTEKKKNIKLKKAIITPIAAVIGLLATAVTAGAIYEGIQYLQRSEYGQIANVMNKIATFVYEDSTENIKMSVEEVLSDGQKTVMTVHYEALTDIGKEWLDNTKLASNPPGNYSLDVLFDSSGDGSFVSGAIGVREIEEYKTENNRYFSVVLDLHGESSENINLRYCLDIGQKKTARISTTNMSELKWYELKTDNHGTDLFTPKYISISDISYTVYGMNHKVYAEEINERGYHIYRILPQDFDSWEYMDFSFVLADGSIFKTRPNGCLGATDPQEENLNTDLLICHGDYHTFIEEEQHWEYIFPGQEIVGVNICGVTYELVPIK